MISRRALAGSSLAVALAAASWLAPAIAAELQSRPRVQAVRSAPSFGFGAFTPASGDPKLASLLARAGVASSDFRFTPSSADKAFSRAVTVAVRARTTRATTQDIARPATVALAPIAYNLGVAVGWKRFALSGDVAKVDLGTQPGSRESADVGVSYSAKAFTGTVRAEASRPLANQPRGVAEQPNYSVDVGGAYSLTRNLALTAGVRYKSERERLPQVTDTRRDSQAVYVGTAFRF